MTWFKILNAAIKRNGLKQLFFYLSKLDASKFIEISKVYDLLEDDDGRQSGDYSENNARK